MDLLNVIQKCVKPKYHLFGHIHEGKFINVWTNTIGRVSLSVFGHILEGMFVSVWTYTVHDIEFISIRS